jgi:hypothetical protein
MVVRILPKECIVLLVLVKNKPQISRLLQSLQVVLIVFVAVE